LPAPTPPGMPPSGFTPLRGRPRPHLPVVHYNTQPPPALGNNTPHSLLHPARTALHPARLFLGQGRSPPTIILPPSLHPSAVVARATPRHRRGRKTERERERVRGSLAMRCATYGCGGSPSCLFSHPVCPVFTKSHAALLAREPYQTYLAAPSRTLLPVSPWRD